MPLPPAVAAHLAAGELAAAREAVRAAFARGVPTGDRRAWALAAEATGSSLLALQAWQAVLAAEPEAADALRRLAELHADRGDAGRAKACRARLRALLGEAEEEPPRPDPAADEPPPAPLGEPGAGDLVRFVHLFAGREGVHARQWADRDKVGYSPVHSALTPELAAAHLRGDVTLGSYLVRRDDRALQLALDLDATKAAVRRATGDAGRARDLRRRIHQAGLALLEGLRAAGFDPLLVDSGYKGRHLWCVLPEPALAGRVRALGEGWARALAPADPELAVEVFPRQGSCASGETTAVEVNGFALALPEGTASAQALLHIDSNGGQHEVPVSVAISAPDLAVRPLLLDLGSSENYVAAEGTLRIANRGGGHLRGEVTSQIAWLRTEPAAFDCAAGGVAEVTVLAEPQDLPEGETVVPQALLVTSNGGQEAVDVRLEVLLTPILQVTPRELTFPISRPGAEAIPAEGQPGAQTLTLTNQGYGALRVRFQPTVEWLTTDRGSSTLRHGRRTRVKVRVDLPGWQESGQDAHLEIRTGETSLASIPVTITTEGGNEK